VLKRYDLSGPELRQLARLERDERVQARLIMIGHMCEGLGPDAAARAVGLRRASGYKWARRYEAEGVAGLSDRPRSGRPAKLDPNKAEAFKERVLDGRARRSAHLEAGVRGRLRSVGDLWPDPPPGVGLAGIATAPPTLGREWPGRSPPRLVWSMASILGESA
jgi:transposase